MSEQHSHTNRPLKYIFPLVFLAVIAIMALYIVRNNFNERERVSDYTNKDTRSDYRDSLSMPVITDSAAGRKTAPDSLNTGRERASMPEADTTR